MDTTGWLDYKKPVLTKTYFKIEDFSFGISQKNSRSPNQLWYSQIKYRYTNKHK